AGYAFRHNAVGRPAPEATATVDGKQVKLSECRGKVVVVAFMADWCGHCRKETPYHQALVKRLKGKPFVLLTIDGDANPELVGEWGVEGYPRVYVIDQKGTVRASDVRGRELGTEVDKLLK